MRTYEILDDASGAVLRTEELEDTMRPSLLHGQSPRLLELDGDRLTKASRVEIGSGTAEHEVKPVPEVLVTETDARAAKEATKAEKAKSAS